MGQRDSRKTVVSVGAWRDLPLLLTVARAGARLGIAGLCLFGANSSLQNAVAEGDTRTLSFHHVHTGEDITVTFKRNGRYDEAALKQLNWFMRDWRKEQETHMDPYLFDLLWEAYRDVGASKPIQVICGYRSPETNRMLRARSAAVAQFSQHINGNAIDFFIPGVPLATVRAEGLRLQRGGVGFYPTSGSPFVHMDTGAVRHWPRIARAQLVKIFPDGRTVHIPSDGHPLPGYALALADIERHGGTVSQTSLNAAREAGVITAGQEQSAERPRRGLLARLFGIGSRDDERSEAPAPKQSRAPMVVASVMPPKHLPVERIVSLPAARPRLADVAVALPRPRPADEPIMTASLIDTFDSRGYWRGAAEPGPKLRPAIAAGTSYKTASLDETSIGSVDKVLAYADAADAQPDLSSPMGSRLPRLPVETSVIQTSASSSLALKAGVPLAIGGSVRTDNPWLRAVLLTPSVSGYMTPTRVGAADPHWQRDLLRKPMQSVMMTFSTYPHLGMVADRFTGTAVVFVATRTFTRAAKTASLPVETTGSLH